MRKHKLPDELAVLTASQLEEVEYWLDRFSYVRVQKLFEESHGFPISIGKLERHFARMQSARLLSGSAPSQPPLSPSELLALRNGAPLPDRAVCLKYVQYRAAKQAERTDLTPAKLKELMDILTYDERAQLASERAALKVHAARLSAWRTALLERRVSSNDHGSPGAPAAPKIE